MKKFKPCNAIRFLARPYLIALLLASLAAGVWLVYYFAVREFSPGHLLLAAAYIALTGWIAQRVYRELWEALWGCITISDTKITWRCPLRRSHAVERADCIIGMGTETSGWNITYYYIYFSKQLLTAKAAGQIRKVPISDTFIRFRYCPELAEYVLAHFPSEKTRSVAYHYEREKRERRKAPGKRRPKK